MNALTRLTASLLLMGLSCSLSITAMAVTTEPTRVKPTTQDKQKASFLFVLRADTGVITKSEGGYMLRLSGMDDKVLYFSDRPVRKAGFMTLSQFMDRWAVGNDSFKTNPPNAAIVHAALKTNGKGLAPALPVELTHPTVTNDGWSFQLKDLQGKINTGSYTKITIFFDDTTITVGGTGE